MKSIQSKGRTIIHDNDIEQMAINQVGDGKVPNKFFLTLSNEMLINIPGTNSSNYATELDTPLVVVSAGYFNTLPEAKAWVNENIDTMDDDPKTVKRVYIEDRLQGEVYEQIVTKRLVPKYDLEITESKY